MNTIQFKSKSKAEQPVLDMDGVEWSSIHVQRPHKIKILAARPEVSEKKPRRRFTAAYKLRILKEYDTCHKSGEIGSLLRREGLYHSNINTWLRQRNEGVLHGLTPKKRGRKARKVNPLAKDVARLERENKKLSKKLQQAETIIEVQKKISEILGIPQDNNGEVK